MLLRFVYSLPVVFLRASAKSINFALASIPWVGVCFSLGALCANNSNTLSPPVFSFHLSCYLDIYQRINARFAICKKPPLLLLLRFGRMRLITLISLYVTFKRIKASLKNIYKKTYFIIEIKALPLHRVRVLFQPRL